MTTRERGQVRTNSSKMAFNEMETPVLDDNKNLNNVQTPSPSVWSKRLHKVPNISFGLVEEFCKKTFDLPNKIQSKAGAFSSVDTLTANISRLWLQINTVYYCQILARQEEIPQKTSKNISRYFCSSFQGHV